jgi:hypothetical protein
MKKIVILLFLTAGICQGQSYDSDFCESTMRIDYFHTGTKGREQITIDKIYREDQWPGSKVNMLDTLDLGDSYVKVSDSQNGRLLYSRGYSTLFAEWQTTDEAISGTWKTCHETVRLPFPKRKVVVDFFRRDRFVAPNKKMGFSRIFSTVINPNDPTVVNTEKKSKAFAVSNVMLNGSPNKKVDILILGDGYVKDDMEKFRKDVKHFTEVLFSFEPFKTHKKDFNVRAIEVISTESGIDMPDLNIWKNTALGTMYNTFGSARYILTEDNRTLRDIAGTAPYDFITILINDNRYGGGGIFNLYTTSFTKTAKPGYEWEMDYVYVHEFGHCFAGLGDEYYNSQISYIDFYPKGIEPWEPNVTRTNTKETLKWRDLVTDKIQIPTPWHKAEYDSIETLRGNLDRLAEDYYDKRESLMKKSKDILNNSSLAGKVGAFEGAGYTSNGMYRPAIDCIMFSLSLAGFDPVCAAAIEKMIAMYAN